MNLIMEDLINIPESIVIPWSGEDPTKVFIDVVFHDLSSNTSNSNMIKLYLHQERNVSTSK